MNGFDSQGYCLGYGGGYFDCTLAALQEHALTIGVNFEVLRLSTIHPQWRDIPMDFVMSDAGIYRGRVVNFRGTTWRRVQSRPRIFCGAAASRAGTARHR